MAGLDGELAPDEQRELQDALEEDAGLREDWQRLQVVKEVTGMVRLKRPPDHVWGTYWQSVYNRLERGLAWVLVSLGAIVLIGWGLWQAVEEVLADTTLPVLVKVAIFAVGLGGLILLLSVLREKLFVRRQDPFREVER